MPRPDGLDLNTNRSHAMSSSVFAAAEPMTPGSIAGMGRRNPYVCTGATLPGRVSGYSL